MRNKDPVQIGKLYLVGSSNIHTYIHTCICILYIYIYMNGFNYYQCKYKSYKECENVAPRGNENEFPLRGLEGNHL